MSGAFEQRFGYEPTSLEHRLETVQIGNVVDFLVDESSAVPTQLGLYAKKDFKKGDLLGVYHGEKCNKNDLVQAIRSKQKYIKFCKQNNIKSSLTRKETCVQMERLGYALTDKLMLIMPRYPLFDNVPFYHKYNAMLFVNEPPNTEKFANDKVSSNHFQKSKINVISYTNYTWDTIDYCAHTDIEKGEELLVFYGNEYRRDNYDINIDGCCESQC